MRDGEEEQGYDPALCAASNGASAPSGLLIPPSNALITYSLAAGGVSVSALFLAGYVLYKGIPNISWQLISTAPTPDERRQRVFGWLDARGIAYTWYEHPEAPTIEAARRYWRDDGSKHCKNLFFRNHKGNRHYLVCFDCERNLAIHDLEHRLRQGKLSFASEQRMERWLGLRPGSVSPFGLINDPARHVHLFLDASLQRLPAYSFHPNDNRSTVVISREEFLRYLAAVGNTYEFIELY